MVHGSPMRFEHFQRQPGLDCVVWIRLVVPGVVAPLLDEAPGTALPAESRDAVAPCVARDQTVTRGPILSLENNRVSLSVAGSNPQ